MPISLSQHVDLQCPECNAPFRAEVWLIVDAGERADLAARCRDGTLHRVTCPNGHTAALGAPLLYHDRAREQLILAVPPGTDEPHTRALHAQLMQHLQAHLLAPFPAYLNQTQVVPQELLPIALADDPQAAFAEHLQRAIPPLLRTLQEFIAARTWDESRRVLHAHPELLSDEADQLLAQLIDAARTQNNADAEKMLAEHHDLLQRARREGIDAAFDRRAIESHGSAGASRVNAADAAADASRLEPSSTSASRRFESEDVAARLRELNIQSPEDFERALREHPDLAEALQRELANALPPLLRALQEFITADSRDEAKTILHAHPELLSDEADQLLAQLIDAARAQNDADAEKMLAEHRDLLQRARREGIEAAFDRRAIESHGSAGASRVNAADAAADASRLEPSSTSASRRFESAEDVAARLRELNIQSPEDFERALREHPDLAEALQRELANALPPLLRALQEFITADSRDEAKTILHAHPELLSDEADQLLAQLIDAARTQNDADAEEMLAEHRDLLQRARREGIEAAFDRRAIESHGSDASRVNAADADADEASRLEPTFTSASRQFELAALLQEITRLTRLSDMPRKIELCERALRLIQRENNPPLWAALQGELANAFAQNPLGNRTENLERAIAHYELALQVYTREQFPEEWAMTQNNLATAYSDRIRGERGENLEEAIRHYELALQVLTRESFPEQWATTQNNLANAYSDRIRGERAENLEEAIRHYDLALQVRTREAFPEQWAGTQNNLANAYAQRIRGERAENLEEAIRHYELALQVRTREAFPAEHRWTARNLGDTWVAKGDWSAARTAYAQAIQTAEQLFRSAVDPTTQRAEAEELADLYDRDIRACVALNDQRRKTKDESALSSSVLRPSSNALVAAEAARSRAFLKQMGLREVAPPADIPAPLIAREQTIIEQLRQIEQGLADVHPHAERASERERALVAQRGTLVRELDEVLDAMLAAIPAAREYVALRRGETPTWDDLRALAERLGKDAALVEFHTLADQIVAMVWRAGWDAPQLVALPLARDRLLYRYLLPYGQEVLNYVPHIRAGRAIHNDWLALGEELLAPLVERRSNGASLLGDASLVYFIPHGALHLVPLHALTVRGKPFIAERAVAYAPSAAVLARALKDEGRKTNDEGPKTKDEGRKTNLQSAIENRESLVMGYTLREEERPTFIGEAEEVAKLFGVAPLVDKAATKDALEQRAPHASLIHLSCHGIFRTDDALGSAVVLADGVFTAREWMGLKLRADLVTLSACQLAFSDVNPGDDLVGMTRALFYAGASAVLLALWSVRADTTMAWMRDFYARVRAGQARAFAAREATLALYAEHKDEPYIWAPFVVVG